VYEAGVGGAAAPPVVKNFRANTVCRASLSCSKILNGKKYFNRVKYFRETVFQGKHKLLKSPECKTILKTVENFRSNSAFQGKRKLLKNLEFKKYIQYSEKFYGKLCFSGQGEKISMQYIQPVKAITVKFLV